MGTTTLGDGTTVAKCDPRVAAIGDVEETRSTLGFLCALLRSAGAEPPALLAQLARDLAGFEQELAAPGRSLVARERLAALEAWLQGPSDLPNAPLAAAQARVCRSICRRAERTVADLAQGQAVSVMLSPYLNRLSDVLQVLAGRLEGAPPDSIDLRNSS
ncbi:MAG TPA: ATP:cob(I)alamin adenosyltransferase [Ramlibacter sp.]|nr:ATP:cob(I)alamin adenosyltransferase [Ramlibacter sp.]